MYLVEESQVVEDVPVQGHESDGWEDVGSVQDTPSVLSPVTCPRLSPVPPLPSPPSFPQSSHEGKKGKLIAEGPNRYTSRQPSR